MYVIIIGGGNVGYYLTKDLVGAGHEVLLLEKERARAQRLAEDLGEVVQQGDGCEARVMEEMGFARADVIVAATGEDEDNLIVCQMAKQRFGITRTIARVNSPANEALFAQLGIDTTVSATRLIFNLIEQEIEVDHLIPVAALARGHLEIVSIELSDQSPVVGRSIGEIALPGDAHIIAILRNDKGMLPSPNAILQVGDTVLTLVQQDQEPDLHGVAIALAVPLPGSTVTKFARPDGSRITTLAPEPLGISFAAAMASGEVTGEATAGAAPPKTSGSPPR